MYPGLLPSVQKAHKQSSVLAQTGTKKLFTITGKIQLHGIYGKVTTVIQTQANNTKLQLDPADGGSNVDLCAVLNISADAVGTIYHITGTVANAMVATIDYSVGQASALILDAGDIVLSCAASNSGEVEWDAIWTPVSPDGNLEAAA